MSSFFLLLVFLAVTALLLPIPALRQGLFLVGGLLALVLWGKKAITRKLQVTFDLSRSCGFPGDDLYLVLHLANPSFFPLFWCAVYQSFPEQLGAGREQVLAGLEPREEKEIRIAFRGRRRGVYALPGIKIIFGDAWGIGEESLLETCTERVIIYPPVSPVYGLRMTRHLPLGPHRVLFGLHEDPARLRGCREYRTGDHLKRMHWPNVARTGQLQVKEWETTLNADIGVFLNLREEDFPVSDWFYLVELEVGLAASLIHRLVEKGENVAFFANGKAWDDDRGEVFRLPPKRGKGQEKKILIYLAGVEMASAPAYEYFFREAKKMAGGSCLLFITPRVTVEMVKRAGDLHKAGYHPLFLWPQYKGGVLPEKELRKANIPWFTVVKRREDDAILLARKG